ncbi:MAG: preprotein translocase subunit SecG [Planctomycetes bacterium]|nr:preprotein translocase subunit SecG [Planctomycetota bacterium]
MPLGVLSQYIFGSLLFVLSFFIIGIILLQRGRGGGLTGALGGAGGQSAFGVKAGDIFTRITAVAVLLWIFTCALACRWYRPENLNDIEANPSAVNTIGSGAAGLGDIPAADLLKSGSPLAPAPATPTSDLGAPAGSVPDAAPIQEAAPTQEAAPPSVPAPPVAEPSAAAPADTSATPEKP